MTYAPTARTGPAASHIARGQTLKTRVFPGCSTLAHRLQFAAGMKTKLRSGLKVRTTIKASGLGGLNHNRGGLKVRTTVKAAGLGGLNHNRALLVAGAR
jgi:hypothetical protein